VTTERIGKDFYDSSDYFENQGTVHLNDHDSPFQRYRIQKVRDIHVPGPDDRVIDLGCGWGTFGFALASDVAEITGVDFSERSIAICEERLAEKPTENLRFLCVDAGATGLPSDSFDLVLAADLFEHIYPEDSQRVAAEAYRILAPGGRFATWTPHRGHILEMLKNHDIILKRDISHVDYKSMDAMRGLLGNAGFKIERSYYSESHLPGFRVIERATQSFLPFMRRRIAVLGRKPSGDN
jgi:ubiquinone/menaquinone biosynthesis C-methylase UbiE